MWLKSANPAELLLLLLNELLPNGSKVPNRSEKTIILTFIMLCYVHYCWDCSAYLSADLDIWYILVIPNWYRWVQTSDRSMFNMVKRFYTGTVRLHLTLKINVVPVNCIILCGSKAVTLLNNTWCSSELNLVATNGEVADSKQINSLSRPALQWLLKKGKRPVLAHWSVCSGLL